MITRRHLLQRRARAPRLPCPDFETCRSRRRQPYAGRTRGRRQLRDHGTLPGKKPLIQLSDRPPNYEAPLEYLRTPITPNDQFFVRYHLADIPEVKAEGYKIAVGGDGANGTAELTLDDLKKMPARRGGRGQPVLGQPAWLVEAARARRGVGLRRYGLRALERRPAQGRARQGRAEERGDRDRLQWRRRAGGRQDARLHQEHSDLEGDR